MLADLAEDSRPVRKGPKLEHMDLVRKSLS